MKLLIFSICFLLFTFAAAAQKTDSWRDLVIDEATPAQALENKEGQDLLK